MKIDGHTEVLAVIGDPVSHTLSPALHRIFIERSGLNLVYVPLHVKAEGLEEACRGAWRLSIRGINVTVPHKQAVMRSLVRIAPEARLIGSVNTLTWAEDGYEGCNTDLFGFGRLVEEVGAPVRGEKVLVLGAGGAANSAVAYAILHKAREIVVYNRTREKAEQMLRGFAFRAREIGYAHPQQRIPQQTLEQQPQEQLPKQLPQQLPLLRTVDEAGLCGEAFPVVFQTTSVGMSPRDGDSLIEDAAFFRNVRYAVDMVYTPRTTRFCALAAQNGARCAGGLAMLFYQGLRSFSIWTGIRFDRAEEEAMYRQFQDEAQRLL